MSLFLKRTFDIVCAGAGLVFLSPLLLWIKLIRPTKIRLQLKYARERFFWTDLKIILLTFQALVKPQSAAVRELGSGDFHRKGAEHAKQ